MEQRGWEMGFQSSIFPEVFFVLVISFINDPKEMHYVL